MRNSTFLKFNLFKLNFLLLFFLAANFSASAQFYTKHYIAPAPWQYFSKANEIVIATNSAATVNVVVSKSDGTLVANLTATKGAPAVYRFAGLPKDAPALELNKVLNAAGLIVTGSEAISINLRNVASDALGGDGSDKDIKGNAALTSFGDAGLGIRYRIGYYRDGSLGNFNNYGDQRPIYTIMAISNGTSVKLNNTVIATLNAGQSYLFKAPIGSLVESSNITVMNTSAAIDTPDGCGDGAYNQIPPEAVLGSEYFIERGKGNDTAEQTTVVATKANTTVTVDTFSATGALTATVNKTLVNAGDFFTFKNGVSNTNFSASRVFATNNVAVYSGTAKDCEVDISTIAPVSECGGSKFIETAKFRNYGVGSLPYFGYVLLKDATAKVYVNGVNIETKSGVAARHQLGTTGWYLINFEDTQIGSPDILSISSDAKLTVSIVQQGGGFSMAGFFSNFAAQPTDPTLTYVSGGGCTNSSATLTTPSGFAPYQWYYNGTAITGATSDTYVAAKSGSYSVGSTLVCGSITQSKPVAVTLCTDLEIKQTVDIASPCVNSNVEFTIKVSNLGVNNATGLSVDDLLPSGFTYLSSVPSTGTYNAASGVWSIGDLDASAVITLKITATVKSSGSYTNTASLAASMADNNTANNSVALSITPKDTPVALSLTGSVICVSPGANGTISSTASASGINYQLYNSSNTAVLASKPGTGAALIWSGLSAGTGYYVIAANPTTSCTATSNKVDVATTPNPIALSLTGSTICVSPGTDGQISSSTSVNGINYQLYNSSNTAVQSAKSGTGAALNWTGLSAGTGYYVISINSTTSCTATSSKVNVSTTPNPAALSLIGSTICSSPGTNGTIVSSTSVSGINYQLYNSSNAAVQAAKSGTGAAITWSSLSSGTGYYVISTSTTGTVCTAESNKVDVSTKPTPVTPVVNVIQPTCTLSTGTITVTSQNAGETYSFNGVDFQTGNSKSGLIAGSYNVIIKSAGGCDSPVKTVVINTQPSTPSQPVLNVMSQPTCANPNGKFIITNYNPSYTYTITPAAVQNGDEITASTGSYKVSAALGSCTSVDSSNIILWSVICAVKENLGPVNGSIGGTTSSLIAGDTFNGAQAVIGSATGEVTLTGTAPTGLTINANGTITVNAGTKAGDYDVTYTICDNDNTGNCSTVTSTVTVTAGILVANLDDAGSVVGSNTAQTLINAFDNDTKNGVKLVPSEVTLTTSTPDPKGYLTLDSNGNAVLGANAPAGDYELTYTICEKLNPSNCSSNTVKVTVTAQVIDAIEDVITSINGNNGGKTVSITANDKLNGNTVVVGTALGEVTLSIVGTLPTGLTLNANGTITVAPNTPAANYNVEYRICENTNPTNCDSVTIIVPVTAGNLTANADAVASVKSSSLAQTLSVNVFDNDTKNGVKLVPSDITLTTSTPDPKGYLVLNSDGTITLGANAPAGDYELTYTICEKLNPSNCSSNTVKVTVTAPVIDAVEDVITSINGNNGGKTVSITANDKLNGNPVVVGTALGEVTLSIVGTLPTGLTLNADGTITVASNTPAANYNVEYRICENTNPTNCDSVTIIVPVTAGNLTANADVIASVKASSLAQTLSVNVFDNDTKNGVKLVPSDVTLTTSTPDPKGYLVLNPDGTITLGANTPAGDYELIYTICEKLNPSNCSSNTVKVTVTAQVIDAIEDIITSINGNNGGKTVSITANDKLNGNPVVVGTALGEVTLSIVGTLPTGLTLNADGTITVAQNTPAANYNVEYRICENTNPTNCDSVTIIVPVTAGNLTANADAVASVKASTLPQTLGVNVFDNDTKNGVKLVPSEVTLTTSTPDPKGYLVLNPDGTITLGANAPAGDYELTYTICEKLNPSNGSSNTVTVTVTSPIFTIIANDDQAGPVDTKKDTSANLNIFDNDLLNGVKPNPADLILTVTVPNANLTLNADGSVSVKSQTPSGVYQLTYQICDAANTANCSQAIVKVTVANSVVITPNQITAVNDGIISVDGINGSLEFVNILDNDLLNGSPINAADVVISNTSANSNFEFNIDGTVNVKPNTPGGSYALSYQICEKANSSNCATAVLNVFVEVPSIAIIKTAIFNDENASGFANAGETITYKFKITNTGNVSLKNIMVTDLLPGIVMSGQQIDLDVNEVDENNFVGQYVIKQADINSGSISNQATVKGNSVRGVLVEDKSDDLSNTDDKPTVLPLKGCQIKVFNAFSPNGDNKNTRFYIQGLECYPDNTVEIYNRWGVLVFNIDRYNNEDRVFKGFSEGRTTVKQSDGLPVGTYYYILKYRDSDSNSHELTGYLYINK
ncbi:T9SS type B sorting domain-containing protein [Flavobacterium reichenbachii]|uniref:T9SS type B sorting domain-containing protein n=1 Tax=Flavobacterium reichenbachii TaxID=362418 RepID=UPI000F51204C|nr:gliding motility-associated C-terminal domain-containing protein [Flavobacterium reichenbachii]